jgi:type IV secretion system protein VirD4
MALILGRESETARSAIGFSSRSKTVQSGELITYEGDGHLITFAPTGTGKTSGPVICNALYHEGQLIVLDIKGEVYAATAKRRREMGQEVHVLDLRDEGREGSLNPLDLAARSGTDCTAIGRSFAAELVEREPGERDRFWNDWSETMIGSATAWALADLPPEKRRLSFLFDVFNHDEVTYNLAVLLDTKQVSIRSASAAFGAFVQLPSENTRPSVLGSVQSHLRLFDSDMTRRLTDTTSFDIDGLIAGKPMSLYIIIPPYRLAAYRPVLRMWISGLLLALTRRERAPEHRTLMLCDEIGNMGKVDAFLTAATLMRGFGVTLWSFFQNPAQLQIYGNQANTFIDNAGVVQFFGPRNRRLAYELAALVGGVDGEAVMRMGPDEQMLLIEGKQIRCRQTRYYDDEAFSGLGQTRE